MSIEESLELVRLRCEAVRTVIRDGSVSVPHELARLADSVELLSKVVESLVGYLDGKDDHFMVPRLPVVA